MFEELKEEFPDLDIEIVKEIVYWDGWSTWEEGGGLLVFRAFDDSLQMMEYGSCVLSSVGFEIGPIQEVDEATANAAIAEMNETIEESRNWQTAA